MTATAAPPTAAEPRTLIALLVTALSGVFVSAQQRINGELALYLNDAVLAAVVSFVTGLVAVALVVLARPAARRAIPLVRQVPWWARLGGLGGASLVAAGAAAAPRIGVALLTIGLVTGQTIGALVVDRLGIGPGGHHLLTAPRLFGAALCLFAVVLSVGGDGVVDVDPLLLAVVIGAGVLIAFQQAFNGRVRRATGTAAVATLVNFVVGTLALCLGYVLRVLLADAAPPDWPGLSQWYLYLGGPIGAAFVAVAAVVVRRLGVLRLGLALVAGQLLGGLVIDVALPVAARDIALPTVLGALLTFVAVAVASRGTKDVR